MVNRQPQAPRQEPDPTALTRAAIGRVEKAKSPLIKTTTRAIAFSFWRRPTLEGPCGPTTIGADGLNCRVRYGNGWDPVAMTAKKLDPVAMPSRNSRRSRRKAA